MQTAANAEVERCNNVLLTLVRAGLWEQTPDDLSAFPLADLQWEQVLRQARQQTVTGLLFRGLQHMPDELLPSEPMLMRLTVAADAVERRNHAMDKALASLCALFDARGITPVLQKGQGIARLYEQPLLRECGDIDLYFANRSDCDAALRCVAGQGARVKKTSDGGFFYLWQGIEVEHHLRLFDLYNPFVQGKARELVEKYGFAQMPLADGSQVTVPSPMLNLLLIDLHILKHALGCGIGLRQICDMARACYKWHGEIDAGEMQAACRQMGIGKWNPLLHTFMVECLGLPVECLPYGEMAATARPLLDIVWRGGNFGHYEQGRNSGGKLHTSRSFVRNAQFSCRYAPKEALWIVADLVKGQFK